MVADDEPENRSYLTRLLHVAGLVELLADKPDKVKTKDDVYWALRWRSILFPTYLNELLKRRRSILARRPGRSDLYVVRDEWIKYEAGEIAHIENILPHELKSRKVINLAETEQTTTQETERTTFDERDSQTSERFELRDEANSDSKLAIHIDGKVDTSGQYGPTHVDTHIGGGFDYSLEQSTRRATTQAKESVSRAVTRVEEKVRNIRTTRTLTRTTETNKHEIKNDDNTPIVGVYRWVNKVQRLQLFRYPNRFLLEFQIPEPAAWWRWFKDQGKNKGLSTQEPTPFTLNGQPKTEINPQLKPEDISHDTTDAAGNIVKGNYQTIAARYATVGLIPPPTNMIIGTVIKRDSPEDDYSDKQSFRYTVDSTLACPDGFEPIDWVATVVTDQNLTTSAAGGLYIVISVGSGDNPPIKDFTEAGFSSIEKQLKGKVGNISTGKIPIAVSTRHALGFFVDLRITCRPLPETIMKWRISTYDLIVSDYYNIKRQHEDEIAARSIRDGVIISGDAPARNKEIIRDELKKLVIEMLTAEEFKGRNALNTTNPPPHVNLANAAKFSAEIQFLEQAFEWENLTYVLYPYYWASDTRWTELADITGADPDFAQFVRSGSARVVVPARPGFEEQVNLYTECGIIWGGGPVPAPGDMNYISVAEEIKAQHRAPDDGVHGESWDVRLPTALVWLENEVKLPEKPNGSRELDEPPGKKFVN